MLQVIPKLFEEYFALLVYTAYSIAVHVAPQEEVSVLVAFFQG